MSLYPVLWAIEHAPVRDAEERAILAALVVKGDFDGRNNYRSYATLGRVTHLDRKTVERKCHAMAKRRLIRRQTGPMPEGWKKLPRDKKTVVWEALIPAEFWSAIQLAEINVARAERGLPPITPENRPPIPEAPPKATRSDKGKPRPRRPRETEPGDSQFPRSVESPGTLSPPARGLSVPPPGDSQSPNPPTGPSDSPSEKDSLPPAVGELQVATGAGAAADAAESTDSHSRRKTPKPREAAPPAAAVELYRRLPERLRERVPEHGSRRVLHALAAELEHRTAAELAERITRRGEAWAYRTEDVRNATAVAITIVRRGYDCPDVRCEDHVRLDTGQPCHHCADGPLPAKTVTETDAAGNSAGDRYLVTGTAGTARPSWCGHCSQQTRQREDEEGRPYRCPACHPLEAATSA